EFLNVSQLNEYTPTIVDVPDVWSRYEIDGETISKYGYATYHLNIKLNETDLGEQVSLYMPNIATAYSLWVNEKQLATEGVIGTSREEMEPTNQPKTVTFEAKDTELDIILQISNFHQRKSGMW